MIRKFRPAGLINFGLAGALSKAQAGGGSWGIGDLIAASFIDCIQTPQPYCTNTRISTPPQEWLDLAVQFGFRPAGVVSSNKPVTNLGESVRLAETGAELVDMEAWGIGQAARQMDVDYISLKVVSDFADERTEHDFHCNAPTLAAAGAERAAAFIEALLRFMG